jgi:chromatin segregation and condensation protein Rec8/ScpA/Scc1 (kleisin family)
MLAQRELYWERSFEKWRDDNRFRQLLVKLGRTEEYKAARETLELMPQALEAKSKEPDDGGQKLGANIGGLR